MKTIYATDIKAMVRKFSLTEDEGWYVNNIAHLVNQENTDTCPSIQETLEHGSWAESRDNAIKAMICYFGAKAQKENDLHNAFDRTSRAVAGKLKCSAYDIRQVHRVSGCLWTELPEDRLKLWQHQTIQQGAWSLRRSSRGCRV